MAEPSFIEKKKTPNPFLVIIKALVLFAILNLAFTTWPSTNQGNFSLYNHLFPGRSRLPFGENPAQAYNLSLFNLNAMFASHEIAGGQKPQDEFRVILIGDSSVWGTLLKPEETLSGLLNDMELTCADQYIKFYNLGYPTISLTKDLMLLELSMRYSPNLVLWPMTLESFPLDKQLTSPLVANNADIVRKLITKYDLPLDSQDTQLVQPTFWERTIIGQRRNLADIFRLQVFGVLWSATGIDQIYPDYEPAQLDFETDLRFHDIEGPDLIESELVFEVISAGILAAGSTPVLIFNEPMLISSGLNSDLRYNFFYPRWAYDQYRKLMTEYSQNKGWNYYDFWNLVPAEEFTNSAIHMTPAGEMMLAEEISKAIFERVCPLP